jgi:hypothetical protein
MFALLCKLVFQWQKPFTAIDANINASITTTIYDAQATNLNNGNVDEGITYSIILFLFMTL